MMMGAAQRVKAICMPTGGGKSPLYTGYALHTGEPTCFVTQNKGLQDQLMCVGLGTKVCTSDLLWVNAESCKIGDVLIGFDEHRQKARRQYRAGVVESVSIVEKECVRFTMTDGSSLISSLDHRWLIPHGHESHRRGAVWEYTHRIRAGEQIVKCLDVWEPIRTFESGYLAAMFDAEGWLMYRKSPLRGLGTDIKLGFAQNEGEVLEYVLHLLQQLRYHPSTPNTKAKCKQIMLGKRQELLRFLGEIRPIRLLNKFKVDSIGQLFPLKGITVLRKEHLGLQSVVVLKTSSATFLANGFASHNSDFSSIGMVDLRGRDNYKCILAPESYTCQDGYASRCPHRGTIQCPSSQAEMRAAISPLVVTNYSKWIAAKKYGTGMSHFTQVIFDEAHHAPAALAQAMQVVLHHKEIEETLEIPFPKYPEFEDIKVWKSWAVAAKRVVEEEILEYNDKIKNATEPRPSWIKHLTHMKHLIRRLSTVSTANPTNWIADAIEGGFQFDPIRPARYGESMLLLNTPSVVMVSATMVEKTIHMSGVGKGDPAKARTIPGGKSTEKYIFVEYDSEFDPKDCPIYYIPTQFVDSKHPDRSMMYMRLDQWLSRRTDRKGIIGTVSHARREEIMAYTRYSKFMIFNDKGEPAARVVEDYRNSIKGPGTILATPSVGTGYDFPGSMCEYIWMCKIPFEPPSKISSARQQDDKEYGGYKAIQVLEQHFGRGARFKGDPCEGAIPDDNCKWFIPAYGHLASRFFHRRYRIAASVPQPPPKYRGA